MSQVLLLELMTVWKKVNRAPIHVPKPLLSDVSIWDTTEINLRQHQNWEMNDSEWEQECWKTTSVPFLNAFKTFFGSNAASRPYKNKIIWETEQQVNRQKSR